MNTLTPLNFNQIGYIENENWDWAPEGNDGSEAHASDAWTAPYPFNTNEDVVMVFKLIINASILPKRVRLGYVSYIALSLLKRIGINPNRFGESERKRLMLVVAREFVAKSLMAGVSGFDSLIDLFAKSDEDKNKLFLHTFIPAFARGIRQTFGRQEVSLRAYQYILASAKLEALRGIDNNWVDLGQAIYGSKMFMGMLSNLELSHDTPDGKIISIIRSIQNRA